MNPNKWWPPANRPLQFKHLVTEAFWGILISGPVRDPDDQAEGKSSGGKTNPTLIQRSNSSCRSSDTREALVHISLWFRKQAERTLLTGWSSARMFWAINILSVHHMSEENPFRLSTELMEQHFRMFCDTSMAESHLHFLHANLFCDMGMLFFKYTGEYQGESGVI